MPKKAVQDHKVLAQRIKTSLQKAEAAASRLRKINVRLVVASITSSAAATLVAGLTAAQGPFILEGIPGWRLACIIAAVFGFVSTVSTGLIQRLKIGERLTKGTQCVGRLRSLEVTMTTGSRDFEKVVEKYEEIARTYPEFIR